MGDEMINENKTNDLAYTFKQDLLQALARGYGHDKNIHKVLDADLIQAMAEEVLLILKNVSNDALPESSLDKTV